MRISDWSSDVCSSDLIQLAARGKAVNAPRSLSNSSDPRFREIPRERVSDRVANELLKLIGDGRLTPGERLPGERQLATMMGVSRVPIRAALPQLKEQGLLSAVQGGGRSEGRRVGKE